MKITTAGVCPRAGLPFTMAERDPGTGASNIERRPMSKLIDATNRFGKRPVPQQPEVANSGVSPSMPIDVPSEGFEYRLVNLLIAAASEAKQGRKRNARELTLAALKSNFSPWVLLPADLGQMVDQADVAGLVFCDDDDDDGDGEGE